MDNKKAKGVKLLVIGLPNTGKTFLLKKLDVNKTLVFARDDKSFPFDLYHTDLEEYDGIESFSNTIINKIKNVKENITNELNLIVFDSVSKICNDIESYAQKKFKKSGSNNSFDIWNITNYELNAFNGFIEYLISLGINIVMITHAYQDDKGLIQESCHGKFAKDGGFLKTTDNSIYTELDNKRRIVYLKDHKLGRSILEDLEETMDINKFDLQEYVDKIKELNGRNIKFNI